MLQPLTLSFLPDAVKSFVKFMALHPILVLFSVLLTSTPPLLFLYTSSSVRGSWHSIAGIFVEVAITLFISPLAFEFLQTQKNSEKISAITHTLRTTLQFLRHNALPIGSPLQWPVFLCLTVLTQLALTAFSQLLTSSPTPWQPQSILIAILTTNFLTAMSTPLLLLTGGILLLVPLQALTELWHYPLKQGKPRNLLGTALLLFYLTPLLRNSTTAQRHSLQLLEINNLYHLNMLFFAWNALRILAAPLALAPLLDAFAFAALLHASLGGSFHHQTNSAPKNSPTKPHTCELST